MSSNASHNDAEKNFTGQFLPTQNNNSNSAVVTSKKLESIIVPPKRVKSIEKKANKLEVENAIKANQNILEKQNRKAKSFDNTINNDKESIKSNMSKNTDLDAE